MKTQLAIQQRDFLEHEKNLDKKYQNDMEVFKMKFAA